MKDCQKQRPQASALARLRHSPNENYCSTGGWAAACDSVSLWRQNEKLLIGQSGKLLSTAENWKDGTHRDEPRGARSAGVAEAGAGRGHHARAGGRKDGSKRSVGAPASGADGHVGRWGCSAWSAGPRAKTVESTR